MADQSLPHVHQLEMQYTWLQGARTRMFRFVDISHRLQVLDLGSGKGHVTAELTRRCPGRIFALDRSIVSLHEDIYLEDSFRVACDSSQIPFQSSSFDLVFTQNSLMWMKPLDGVISEIWRIIEPGGWLVAIEPDYGGYIEFPPSVALKEIWISALYRSGAEPLIGRMLPTLLEMSGFQVRVFLFDRLELTGSERIDLIKDLPLTEEERMRLNKVESSIARKSGWQQLAHLPYFMIAARK
jgi:ubiquinone/menaquinone biosynthesis C-methylase UbiE